MKDFVLFMGLKLFEILFIFFCGFVFNIEFGLLMVLLKFDIFFIGLFNRDIFKILIFFGL